MSLSKTEWSSGRGPIEAVAEAESFDALFCHDDDEERFKRLARAAGFDVSEPGHLI